MENQILIESMMASFEAIKKDLLKTKEDLQKEISKNSRFIIMVDLAESTDYKLKHSDDSLIWIRRQVHFMNVVQKSIISTISENENLKKESIFLKFIGDEVFVALNKNFTSIIEKIVLNCSKAIDKIGNNGDFEHCNFHMSVDYGSGIYLMDKDPIGPCVDRCARILGISSNNQILFSEDALNQLNANKTESLYVKLLSNVLLKGSKTPTPIFEFIWDAKGERRIPKTRDVYPSLDIFLRNIYITDNVSTKEPNNHENRYDHKIKKKEKSALKKMKIAAIGPHPDDIELGCGGSLSRFRDIYEAEIYWYILATEKRDYVGRPLEKAHREDDAKTSFRFLLTGNMKEDPKKFKYVTDSGTNIHIYSINNIDGVHQGTLVWGACHHDFDQNKKPIRDLLRAAYVKELRDVDIIFSPSAKDVHQDHKTVAEIVSQTFRKQESILYYRTPDSGKHPFLKFNPNLYVSVSDPCYEYGVYSGFPEKKINARYIDIKLKMLDFYNSEKYKYWFDPEIIKSIARENALDAYLMYDFSPDNKEQYAEGFEGTLRM